MTWGRRLGFAAALLCVYTLAHGETLEHLNRRVNASIIPRPANNWDFTPYKAEGNCNTYAATKRAELLKAGYASGRLVLWLVRTERGDLHSVLVVDGDQVLDNRTAWVERRAAMPGYSFIRPID